MEELPGIEPGSFESESNIRSHCIIAPNKETYYFFKPFRRRWESNPDYMVQSQVTCAVGRRLQRNYRMSALDYSRRRSVFGV